VGVGWSDKTKVIPNSTQLKLKLKLEFEFGNIAKGMEKLPQKEREQILYDENKARLLELAEAKKNLWKMRTKEKKINKQNGPTEIQKLGLKAEKIAGILKKERERIRLENEKKEREKQKKEQIRKEKVTRE